MSLFPVVYYRRLRRVEWHPSFSFIFHAVRRRRGETSSKLSAASKQYRNKVTSYDTEGAPLMVACSNSRAPASQGIVSCSRVGVGRHVESESSFVSRFLSLSLSLSLSQYFVGSPIIERRIKVCK